MRSPVIDRRPLPPPSPVLRALLAALVIATVTSPADAVPCPESTIYGVPSTAAVRDSFHATAMPRDTLEAHYDLTEGTLSCRRRKGLIIEMEIELVDDYEIVGLPAGTPVAVVARFAHNTVQDFGTSVSGLVFRARLLEGAANLAESQGLHWVWSDVLELPIAAVAGTPFQLRSRLYTSTRDGQTRMTGALTFSGLPPGCFIRSCQGYRQDGPVAATPTSWGRIKTRYR